MAQANQLWVLIGAVLVFFMQAGFLCLETGLVRPRNATITALKNIIDWCVASVTWTVVGFGLAFGPTLAGLVGAGLFMGERIAPPAGNGLGWAFLLFQLGFAGAAVTIVSGALAERVGFVAYLVASLFNACLVYPVVAHWVWGGAFLPGQATLLAGRGFQDFAGATVVHSVGGWISLVGIWMVGPRLGRFDAEGRVQPMESYSLPLAALGSFFLWVGWWGFNGASTLLAGEGSAEVIAVTNVAGAAAGLAAYLHGRLVQRTGDLEAKLLGGALTGLVAITACANVVTAGTGILVGAAAGVLHNVVFALLLRLRLDDPVGAVPVHLGGGVFGTLCVGLLGKLDRLEALTGGPASRLSRIGTQLIGISVVAVWTVAASLAVFWLVKVTVGLRASPEEEAEGLNIDGATRGHAVPASPLDRSEIERLMS
jgi:Amt family ammonium transporter